MTAHAGRWAIVGAEWLPIPASSRSEAVEAARAAVAAVLEVAPYAFDVESS